MPASPEEVLTRVLREQAHWDEDLLESRVAETLDERTEVYQYVRNAMAPHPTRDHVVLRYERRSRWGGFFPLRLDLFAKKLQIRKCKLGLSFPVIFCWVFFIRLLPRGTSSELLQEATKSLCDRSLFIYIKHLASLF